MRNIAIVGAGLSGVSCGIHLVSRGYRVTILESRSVVGGRTSSWNEKGMEIESGFHKYLGFYSELPRLLKQAYIDVNRVVIWEDRVEIHPENGSGGIFYLAPLFRPLQTILGFLGNNHILSLKDKLSLVKVCAVGLLDFYTRPHKLDSQTLLEFAKKYGATQKAITNFFIPTSTGVFFLPIEKYSAYSYFGFVAAGIVFIFMSFLNLSCRFDF